MMNNNFWFVLLACAASLASGQQTDSGSFHPVIPRAWDDREVASFEVPLAQPERSPRYLSAAEYYALDVLSIYRGYPVYVPGKEPAGYMDRLKQVEPEIAFD